MRTSFTTSTKYLLFLFMLLACCTYGQAPTITTFTPTRVTQRTVVTINGTNFTANSSVTFGNIAAASVTYVSSTKLLAEVNTGATGSVKVTTPYGNFSKTGLNYVAPATPSSASISRVITDWEGYWSSTSASTNPDMQPDTQHNLLAFKYGTTLYSTGVNNNTLYTNGLSYTNGDFRALPVSSISGNASGANFISLGNKIDGNATATDYLSPAVNGLKVQDVLIDGTKGLGLGSGVTNINSSAVLLFNVNSIVSSKISDTQPDIIITQTADPTNDVFDIFCFVDANGNIIGNPVQANFYNISPVGTYKVDLFTLQEGEPYSTVTPSANGYIGGNTRNIRMVAFKLSDFGITTSNYTTISKLKYMPSGDSDPAFMAYNAGAMTIPAPVITTQPVSLTVCPGSGNATFSVTATGTGLSYQWRKNSIDIAGATASSYTIVNPQQDDVAAYSVVVSNASGSVASNIVYLNTIISLQPADINTCINTAETISFTSNGADLAYQWYSNLTQSNNGGTLINGATSSSYTPPSNVAGTKYYYCVITNNGSGCAGARTNAIAYTLSPVTVGGNTSANTTICSGSSTTVALTNTVGSIQWQQSTNNIAWTDINGATTATYTTPPLSSTTYYRARVTSGACLTVTTAPITVTVNPLPVAGTASANQQICPETTITLSLAGVSGSIQWQQSATGDGNWENVTGGSGAATATYTTPPLTEKTYYRAIVSNGTCSAISQIITISVKDNVWTGATGTNWHTSANWSCGSIPTANHHVVIATATNQPVVTSATQQAQAKSLTLQDNTTLTAYSNTCVAVTGAVNVAPTATFVLADDANLLQSGNATNSGKITMHKNSSQLYRLDYTFWSSPVSGQELYAFSPATITQPEPRWYVFNTDENIYQSVSPFENYFEAGKSYMIRMPNQSETAGYNEGVTPIVFDGIFTGVPHNGDITVPVSSQNTKANSIGNPYPSPLSVKDFFLANVGNLQAGHGLYFWRKKNNSNASSFATLTLAGFVANQAIGGNPGEDQFGGAQWAGYFNAISNTNWVLKQGQGFFVVAADGAEQVVFTNSMRRDRHNTAFFRTNEAGAMSRLWLDLVSPEGQSTQAALAYSSETTLGLDYGYDGKTMPADGVVALYSMQGEDAFAIQARPDFEDTDSVALGYKAGTAGNYTLSLGKTNGVFAEGQKVYLKDLEADITHNLNESDYTFTTGEGIFNNRFQLVYMPDNTLNIGSYNSENTIVIYKKDSSLAVKSAVEMASLKVFDIQGRIICQKQNINANLAILDNLHAEHQVLLIEVTATNGTVTTKKGIY